MTSAAWWASQAVARATVELRGESERGAAQYQLKVSRPGYMALVRDSAHRQRMDLYRSATTDEFGRFHVQDIAPGSYLVFAWEDIEDGLWRDPEFIRRNEESGKSIQIDERTRATVEVTAFPFSF